MYEHEYSEWKLPVCKEALKINQSTGGIIRGRLRTGRSELEMSLEVRAEPRVLPSRRSSQPQEIHIATIFSAFQSSTWTSKVFFLFPLTAAFHSAAGQGLTRGGGRRFSPDLRVQMLVRSPALPTSSRRFLLGWDADRILRGFFLEWRDRVRLRRCFKYCLACVVEIYHLN